MSDRHEETELRKAGLKVTHPRLKIYELLESNRIGHMSAEDVYRQLIERGDEIGLATVYRVLTQFETAGIVVKHNFDGGQSVFELADGEHHDHMVCIDTGAVVEFFDDEIEKLQQEIAEKNGYDLIDHSLVLYVRPKKK